MPDSPDTVDDYVGSLPDEVQEVVNRFRRIISSVAPDVVETIRYQMPTFSVDGVYIVYLGAWKKHIGLYPIPTLAGDLEDQISPYRSAKDTLRFPYNQTMPYELIERLIIELTRMRLDHE